MEKLIPRPPAEIMTSPPLEIGINDYCIAQADQWSKKSPGIQPAHIRAEMEANYQLLEPMDEQQEAETQPAMTVCIPVALMREDQATVDRVLDTVHNSKQALGQPVEVVLWANAPASPEPQKANMRYQELRDSLNRFGNTGLQVKTALQILPEEGASISQIRANYMEAAAIDALKNGRDGDHPILWLDADTTYLSSNTLGAISEKLQTKESLFVHASERFTTEWADGLPMSERDVATRALMVHEMHRRKYVKKFAETGQRLGYPEESGLAFTLGTYLKLGGVNTEDPVNEASTLLSYAKELVLEGEVTRFRSQYGYGRRFPKDVPGVLEYLPTARIGISARRLYEAAKVKGAIGILYPGDFTQYTLFTDNETQSEKPDQAPITREDIRDLITKQETRHAVKSRAELDDKDKRLITNVIKHEFSD